MADADTPIITTPKRKRSQQQQQQQPPSTPVKFSFDPLKIGSPDDGSRSPRSCVAHRFRGLALSSGEPDDEATSRSDPTRKRRKCGDDPMTGGCGFGSAVFICPDVAVASTEFEGQPSHPRPPRRKRAGTPPLRLKSSPTAQRADDQPQVVDPIRAALTWHEDEITVYDPHDADDDGVGVNGVGFKPTPAIAHARVMKRRQQMADYRRREESDARARRSQRRRGEAAVAAVAAAAAAAATAAAAAAASRSMSDKSPTRKVRFMDTESQNVAVTTV
ncbi:hypothetical protein L249_0028 [Ophiocordyceps polyrhachis-furcata BCC 54312]|uniref:Uncharacterized protein n=1 Tax=Ophiocordyceps polyrhachis-furcata BCC 54312 TaxID=1330021 RepID=A0A367LCH2_9HYPO|nr:hypothetical protein L249_0028 [Ophiocordyceps polyrhachis-furcata BCC 54312]